MNQQDLDIEARLRAIEIVMAWLFNEVTASLTDDEMKMLHDHWSDDYEALTFAGMDASMSDQLADEVRRRTGDLLAHAANLRAIRAALRRS